MSFTFFYKVFLINLTYRYNNLLIQQSFGSHVDLQFGFGVLVTLDNFLNVIDVGHLERRESYFDFQHFFSIADVSG